MGYTHYWTQKRTLSDTEWNEVRMAAVGIFVMCHARGIALGDWEGKNAPEIDNDVVSFNGARGNSCETCMITKRHRPIRSWFCKTNRQPYDAAVTALLIFLADRFPEAFDISTDGDAADWEDGLTLIREADPGHEYVNPFGDGREAA